MTWIQIYLYSLAIIILQPVVFEEELEAGLRLAPLEKDVTVVNKAVFGIIFSQFRATIDGRVKCLGWLHFQVA